MACILQRPEELYYLEEGKYVVSGVKSQSVSLGHGLHFQLPQTQTLFSIGEVYIFEVRSQN